jgi:hypothetical protein
MKRMTYRAMAFSSAVLFAGSLAVPVNIYAADSEKLTGCLIRGEGDGAGYLLVNVPAEPAAAGASRPASPGAIGTSGVYANVFYWLDKNDDLREHIGHRVEVEGDVKGSLKEGEIEIDRKDEWTEIEVKADGREMKAKVPNASVVAGGDRDRKIDVLVKRLDVEKVRMLDAVCR